MPHRDSSRSMILERAVQLASRRGLHGLSIGQLAEDVRMTKGGVCAHFPSKDKLQLAVIERAAEKFRESAVAPGLQAPPGKSRLRALMESWFRYQEAQVFEGGCFFVNALLELDDLEPGPVLDSLRVHYDGYLKLLESEVVNAIEQGELARLRDPGRMVFTLHALQVSVLSYRGLNQRDRALGWARNTTQELLG